MVVLRILGIPFVFVFWLLISLVRLLLGFAFGFRAAPQGSPFPDSMHQRQRPAWQGFYLWCWNSYWAPSVILGPVVLLCWFAPETVRKEFRRSFGWAELNLIATEVHDNVFVAFTFPATEKFQNEAIAQIVKDYKEVEQRFESPLAAPVLIYVEPGVLETANGKAEGYHLQGTHPHYGHHHIHVGAHVLFDGVVRHELAHAYIEHLNPRISLMLNEGLAHLVGGKKDFDAPLASQFAFPDKAYWRGYLGIQNRDDFRSRAYGWATAYYLHKTKKLSLRQIAMLAPTELPSEAEIRGTMRTLVLEYCLNEAELQFLLGENGFSTGSFERLALNRTPFRSGSDEEFIKGSREWLIDLGWMCLYHLKTTEGKSFTELKELSAEEVYACDSKAFQASEGWWKEYKIAEGRRLVQESPDGFDLECFLTLKQALKANVPGQETKSSPVEKVRLARAEGWAQVYRVAKQEKMSPLILEQSKLEQIPALSQALLDELLALHGTDPHLYQHVLSAVETMSRQTDLEKLLKVKDR